MTFQNIVNRFANLGLIQWAACIGALAIITQVPQLHAAQASYAIPYQTVLRKDAPGGGQVPIQGTVYFKFVIYRVNQPEGGGDPQFVPVWSHDPGYIAGLDPGRIEPVPEPVRLVSLQAVDGIASLLLGGFEPSLLEPGGVPATTPPGGEGVPVRMPALDAELFAEGEMRLRIWFGESSASLEILGPDLTLAASPFALRAALADGVAPGSVGTGALAPEVAELLSATETLQALTDRMVLISDVSDDPSLIDEGFVPVRTLDPAPWDKVGEVGAPSGRVNASTAWTGNSLLVWGGAMSWNGSLLSGGSMYNPQEDSWSLISTVGRPAGREGAVSVWTGTLWIIWGGFGESGMLADGGIFDPAKNLWAALPNVPVGFEERVEATAVWTGTHMIVWGGRSLSGALADGAAYDPDADTWTLLPAFPGAARSEHRAVWTGSRMIVWGGRNDASEGLSDGYVFNPGSDPFTGTWETMTASGLSGRWAPAMVWTDEGLVVWGGATSSGVLNSGAVWTMADNSWDPLPDPDGFLPAASHVAAVSTSIGVFFWGGATSGSVTGAGAYLDLSTMSWFAPPLGAPAARRGHALYYIPSSNYSLLYGGADPSVFGAFNDVWRLPAERTQYLYRKP